jgi:predicted permease
MILLMAVGVVWRYVEPAGLSAKQVRETLGALVINLMAPALILEIMLISKLGKELYQIPLSGYMTVTLVLGISLLLFSYLSRKQLITRAQAGALVMASAFGNGMGLGLPVIDALLNGEWNEIPLVYDLLTTIPYVWIVGVLLCAHFGTRIAGGRLGQELFRLPPFWAVIISLLLRQFEYEASDLVLKTLHLMGEATIPLLLLMVGLSLSIGSIKHLKLSIPVLLIKVLLSPLIAFYAATFVGLEGLTLTTVVLTSAAPAVAVGIALSDRFKLDTELFCTAMTLSMVMYVLLAPVLLEFLT